MLLATARRVEASPAVSAEYATAPSAPPPREQPSPEVTVDDAPVRFGAVASISFPRPISIEAMVKLAGYVGLGVDYGVLPTLAIDGVDASLWSVGGNLYVFPFRGAFFLGLGGGYQTLSADGSLTILGLKLLPEESVVWTSWYVTPRLGFLWRMKFGLTIGMDAGVQLPLSTSYSASPQALAVALRSANDIVRILTGPLPAVDLLRLGFLF